MTMAEEHYKNALASILFGNEIFLSYLARHKFKNEDEDDEEERKRWREKKK